jgi:hypothetical protein
MYVLLAVESICAFHDDQDPVLRRTNNQEQLNRKMESTLNK